MIIALFQVNDKDVKFCFFEKTLLLADISMDIAFEMLFSTLNNIKVKINTWELRYRLYTIAEAVSITRQVELVGKKEFAPVAFNLEYEIFVVHVAFLAISDTSEIHPFRRA